MDALRAAGGVEWTAAESNFSHFHNLKGYVRTIRDFPPGYETPPFPSSSLRALGVTESTQGARACIKADLLRTYDAAVAAGHWPLALRCGLHAELIRRTACVHAARGGSAAAEFVEGHGGVYVAAGALPPSPDLAPVFHSMSYGSGRLDLALMQAIGVRPLPGAAGFEVVSPMHVVIRGRNIKARRPVLIPCVIAKAQLPERDTSPGALARRLRPLIVDCEAAEASPLGRLELQVLACIPSGRLLLPPMGSDAPPRYEHLFGVADDTRRFWLTSYDTDRLQFPCAVIVTPQTSPIIIDTADRLDPARVASMRALQTYTDAQERAMFQVMLNVWGIDRLIIGRPLVWRERSGAPTDDLSFFADSGADAEYPRWVPQQRAPSAGGASGASGARGAGGGSSSSPRKRRSLAEEEESDDDDNGPTLPLLQRLRLHHPHNNTHNNKQSRRAGDSDVYSSSSSAASSASTSPQASHIVEFRPPGANAADRLRSFRGSGRLNLEPHNLVQWASDSLLQGALLGGTCATACRQDDAGLKDRWKYYLTPGTVIGIIDTIMSEVLLRAPRGPLSARTARLTHTPAGAPPPAAAAERRRRRAAAAYAASARDVRVANALPPRRRGAAAHAVDVARGRTPPLRGHRAPILPPRGGGGRGAPRRLRAAAHLPRLRLPAPPPGRQRAADARDATHRQ